LTELRKEGFLGFIIPKAFTFASNYKKIRQLVWDDLKIIIDGSKVWKEVKLEQVVIIVEKDVSHKIYQSGIAKDEQILILGKIDKKTAKEFGFFLNGVSDEEIIVARKMLKNSLMLKDVATNQRGAMLQKEVGEVGELEVLGGASISRMGIREIKGKINKEKVFDDKAFIKPNSVLVQNIVAHIENPTDHIKIISAISDDKNYIILDTINQLAIDKQYSNYFIWSLLNSELVNWYVYRFIYGKAVRTMHFDNFVTDRLPIPKVSTDDQGELIKLAKTLVESYKKIGGSAENSNEWQKIKDEIFQTDKKIDEEVYGLYGLSEEEIKIVEGEKQKE